MKIELKEITVRELTKDYQNDDEDGVLGYSKKLDIRPPYQREFIYNDKQREAVIDTIIKGFPLNVMYWSVQEKQKFELIDGQQRTISICQYVDGDFSYDKLYFNNLKEDKKEKILDYKIMVYFCSGTDTERLQWFERINIAGEKLTKQELRNAVYSGPWVTDLKKYFSKTGCVAYAIGSGYLNGTAIRQDYLETVLRWISDDKIDDYMAKNANEASASDVWLYFQKIMNWIKTIFPNYRKEMKGVDWGNLFNIYGTKKLDPKKLEQHITKLMQDEDVQKKKGIYNYLLTGEEKYLNVRAFSPNQRREAYERQKGICTKCLKHFKFEEMEADHIKPWHEGGKTIADNCQMLCIDDNRRKSGK